MRTDWNPGYHRVFCGSSGEIDIDFQISASYGRGFGLFAKRLFKRGEVVLAERCLMHKVADPTPQSTLWALNELEPYGEPIQQKFRRNAFDHGLYLVTARINHDCIGNCTISSLDNPMVSICTASRDIFEGEEITISYVPLLAEYDDPDYFLFRKIKLKESWDFVCYCEVCTSKNVANGVQSLVRLKNRMVQCFENDLVDEFIDLSELVIEHFDLLKMAYAYYEHLYYSMFLLTVTRRKTLAKAQKCFDLAIKFHRKIAWECLTGTEPFDDLYDMTKHPDYLCNERR